MGVPKFYRWMSERYPCLNQVVRESEIPEFDNLYLDMNGIIHACSHPNDEDVHFRLPEEVMVKDIFKYIETLFNIIKPKKTFFMAVDGVAPRAKMNQQRGRRFRSAKDAIAREVEAQNKGEILPQEARFDSNCITPGTDFMARLQAHLEYFVTTKVSNDELWRNVTVILSGHETPGEGEHKIMDFIRTQRSQPDYDPNTRHCLYGLDADLIMLGMCSHEPYFALLREEVKFRRRKEKETTFHVNPEAINFHLLHLSLLRDYLDHEFSPLKTILPFQYDLEHIIDDWVLMGFLCGNDFIPHLPHFHIAKNALTTLYKVYMEVLPNCDDYLNHHGKLNLRNFQKFLHKLSEIDVENFNEMNADFKYLESKSRSKFKSPRKLEKYEDCIGVVGESLESGPDSDSNLIDLGSDGASDDVEEEEDEEDVSSSEEDDTLEDEFKMHKRDYYRTKMNYEDVTPEVLKEQAYCYIKAIQWNLHYYYDGCPSWSWYYPHHYAPYISDVKSFENIDLTFNLGQPFKPFEQLLGVLPAASKEFLPKPYQRLVTDENSPLKDYYPADFELDLNGKVNNWEAVVVIPFIDEKKLLNAAQSCESQLTAKEKKRNSHGPHLQFNYSRELQPRMPSTIPTILPDIEVNRAKKTLVNKNEYCIPRNSIRKGILPGIDLDMYTPGFPTLRTMKHTARLEKASIRVFEMPSSGSSILIDLTPKPRISLQSALADYLGQTVYINWPFLTEAKVSKICDGDKLYVLNSTGHQDIRELRDKEKRETAGQVRNVVETLKNRRGIHLPEFDIVFYCKPLTGCKYNLGPNGQVSLDKQWSPIENCVPCPMAIKQLPIRLSSYERTKKMEEIFPIGSKCFILTETYYGDIATIEEVQKKTNKIKVNIHRVAEPDLDEVKGRGYELMNKEYMTNHALASKLGLNPCLVSRLTGVVMIEKSNGDKVNIGLNLKFVTKREYVPGYSQRREETWLFSWKTFKIMEEYCQKYPELFHNLSRLSDQKRFQPNQIFNGPDPESKISEVAAWLKKMPYQNARRMKYDAEALDEVIVKCIEDVLDSHKVFATELDTVKTVFSTNQVFRPANLIGHSPPDPMATFNLFDRVVNVREGISVPLGARGVVIGKTKDRLDDDTYLCDIVFDEPFIGGLSLNCSQGRGYRLHPYSLINISFKKMKVYYGEDFDLPPIQPFRGETAHRNKGSRTKASPGQKKLIDLPPNRERQKHDFINKREYLDQGNRNAGHSYQTNNHNNSNNSNNSSNNNYHNEQRNSGKQRVMSSPIQINHSPRSLFQNPREAKNNAINHNKTTVPTSILTRVKQEASPPDDSHMLVASSGSSASASTTPKTFTGTQFMDLIRGQLNKGPARNKLDDWCKLKFGQEPVYKMESFGPGAANPLKFATLKLPDNSKFSESNPNSAASDLVFENLAIQAIHRLKIEPDPSGGVPAPFEPPTSILPPPPPPINWIEQKDLEAQIPSSYVTANQKIIQSVIAERKQTPSIDQVMRANAQRSPVNHQYYNPQSQHQQQRHHHQSNQPQHLQNHQLQLHQQQQQKHLLLSPLQQNMVQQPTPQVQQLQRHKLDLQHNLPQQNYQQHFNHRNGNNNNNRNVQYRGPLHEGPIMTTRPVSMQPFQQNLQLNPQKPKLRPHWPELSRPPQGPRAQASKFIPLQVERNKQPPRDTNQNHHHTNSSNLNQQKRNEVQQLQPRKQQSTTPVENKTIESKKNEINENRSPKTPDPVDTAVKSSNRRRSRVVMSFDKP